MARMASETLFKLGLLVLITVIAACGAQPAATPAPPSAPIAMRTVELKAGNGTAVAGGQIAVVQYTGWLYEAAAPDNKGKQFDSSRTGGRPFRFPLGTGAVIKGWDQGVAGMKIGESRRLIIPPELAYGDSGAGGVIPPGATLVFDIDLVSVK